MPLTQDDLERARSPADLREFVLGAVARVKENREELSAALMKSGLYKQFRDEITFIGRTAERLYPANILIQPKFGNQGYDAVVLDASGRILEKIEVTAPHDGAAENAEARKAIEQGTSIKAVREEDIPELRSILLATCKKKASKDYPDCTLIIAANWAETVLHDEEEQDSFMKGICDEVRTFQIRAKRVVLYDGAFDRLYEIGAQPGAPADVDPLPK